MYRKILACLDNSDLSGAASALALKVAAATGASATGCHVYAARLHDARFRQMEPGLPEKYQEPDELGRQREVHDTLITKGLETISDSYLAVFQAAAASAGVEADPRGVSREGRNYSEILKEAREGGYDLVALGSTGLGETTCGRLGSVAERVARGTGCDVLVARTKEPPPTGAVVAAVDGSPRSFGAVRRAVELARVFSSPVELVSVFDPDFHYRAFRSLAGVLSEEGGRVFRFREQERLHEEIIDRGLAKIYEDHLYAARALAASLGVEAETTLLAGKPVDRITEYVRGRHTLVLVLGKTGVHDSVGDLDIGATAENCLRESTADVLLTTLEASPPAAAATETPPGWTEEAERLLERIPPFARGVARRLIEARALDTGLSTVTVEFMVRVREDLDL